MRSIDIVVVTPKPEKEYVESKPGKCIKKLESATTGMFVNVEDNNTEGLAQCTIDTLNTIFVKVILLCLCMMM